MNGRRRGPLILRWVTAFALAIPPLAVALLTHQAIQHAWLPAIPWWDKLIIGAVLYAAVCVWSVKCAQQELPDLAPIPIASVMMGTILIFLDVLSSHVRPDIAAAWSATWGRIPWWDKLVAGAVVYGLLLHSARKAPAESRHRCANATFLLVLWANTVLVVKGPLHEMAWASMAFCIAFMVACVWTICEAVRSWPRTNRGEQVATADASGPSDRERSHHEQAENQSAL